MEKKSTENRRIALEILMEASDESVKLSNILKNSLDKIDYMDRQDKAFISRLVRGCIERRITLDYVVSLYAKTKKIKPVIKNILRMAIYQILYMDSVKDFAACSEAVNLTKDRGLVGLSSFVNGVLRNIAREKENIKWPDKDKTPREYLSICYSMPLWIVEYVEKMYGMELAERMFDQMNQETDLTIRVSEDLPNSKIEDLIMFIERAGVVARRHQYSRYAYILENVAGVAELPGFNEGLFTVQDISSQMAIRIAGISEGDKVLDMCAAPGGKTMHASIFAGDKGSILARDISQDKIDLIEENARRLGRQNINTQIFDASRFDEESVEKYDVVICDAPCSGLGVMGRKPDIRYNVSQESVKVLAGLQRKILSNAVQYVKKGGTLLFSTCTITKEENFENRQYIIDELGMKPYGFADMVDFLDEESIEQADRGELQLLPGVHDSDGFYISRFIKE